MSFFGDWMLLGIAVTVMRHLTECYPEGQKTRVKLKLQVIKRQLSLTLARWGSCAHFVFGTMFINLSVFSYDCKWSCFVLIHPSHTVTFSDMHVLGSCLCSTQHQDAAESHLLAIRGCFSLSQWAFRLLPFFLRNEYPFMYVFHSVGSVSQGKFLKFGFLGQKTYRFARYCQGLLQKGCIPTNNV